LAGARHQQRLRIGSNAAGTAAISGGIEDEAEGVHRRIWSGGTLLGYSIGEWIDLDGDGRYDVLEVETRGLRGPRSFDASGLPLHADNETVVKEKIYIDKSDPNIAHDEVTVIEKERHQGQTM
jgi:hypothetical protein